MKYRIKEFRYYDIDSTNESDKYGYSIVQYKRLFFWHTLKARDGKEAVFNFRSDAEKYIKHKITMYSKVVEVFDSKKGVDRKKAISYGLHNDD